MRPLEKAAFVLDRTAVLFIGLAAGAVVTMSFFPSAAPGGQAQASTPVPAPVAAANAAAAPLNRRAADPLTPRLAEALREGRPIRIGVYGDSFGDGVWAGLYNILRRDPGFEVRQYSERATGFTRAEVLGRPAREFVIPPEEADAFAEFLTYVWRTGTPSPQVGHWMTKDGGRRLIAWSNKPMTGAGGGPMSLVTTGIDLTDRSPLRDEDERALAAAVKAEAPDHIPMPIDEAVVDFQSLGVVETPAGPRSRVVIVAVRREMIDRLVSATREAGLELEGIDLAAFGMVRALAGDRKPEGAVLVNVAGLTNVAVANGSGCLFTRAAAGGLDAVVHNLSERRGLTQEHARQWMQHVGLLTPLEDVEGDEELVTATRAALEEGVHQLADTVRNSLNFYRMQEGAETVERALLTGPVLAIPGFADKLSDQLRLPVEPAFVVVDGDEAADPARMAVAAGLAIEDRV